MQCSPEQLSELLKMRALGFNQAEIASALNSSQQTIAYHLKKLKSEAQDKGMDEVFNAALLGGLIGVSAGIGTYAVLELLKERGD